MDKQQIEAAKSAYIERLALTGEEDGMPRIAGRLIGYLTMNQGAYSLDEIADALQASKASVSTNARLLEERGILIRTSSPGDRRDFYEISPAPWEMFINNATRKVQKSMDAVEATLPKLPPEDVANRRLKEARLFYRFLLDRLAECKVMWQQAIREAEQNGEFDLPKATASDTTKEPQ
ncbi:MAG: MarR family transcriptional regulator [Gemmatimonadota bacterium]